MALIDSIEFTQNASDIDLGTLLDASDYGVGGNPARSATANYMLWSKTDENGNRVFDYPVQGNELSTISYQVNTLIDGYYEAILQRIGLYNPAASYVEQQQSGSVVTQWASIVYDPVTDTTFRAIAPSTGQAPTNPAFFTPLVLTDLPSLILNTNVHTFIKEVYINVRVSRCANRKFQDSCGCGCNGDLSKIAPALNIRYKIIAADTAFRDGNPEEMEKIIREATEICSNC
jgi:hypothetical protein